MSDKLFTHLYSVPRHSGQGIAQGIESYGIKNPGQINFLGKTPDSTQGVRHYKVKSTGRIIQVDLALDETLAMVCPLRETPETDGLIRRIFPEARNGEIFPFFSRSPYGQ
jgi:hypothetical protein